MIEFSLWLRKSEKSFAGQELWTRVAESPVVAKVWKQKIGFDPRFSTFDPRYLAKGTNIKRDLTRHQASSHKRMKHKQQISFGGGGKQ